MVKRPLLLATTILVTLFSWSVPAHADAPAVVKVCSSSPEVFGILANTTNPLCASEEFFSSSWHLGEGIDTATRSMNACMSTDPNIHYFDVEEVCRSWQKSYTYSRAIGSTLAPTIATIEIGINTVDLNLTNLHWVSDAPIKFFTVKSYEVPAIKDESATAISSIRPKVSTITAAKTASGAELPQSLRVAGLKSSTSYIFTVSSTTVDGRSEDSVPTNRVTTHDPLPDAPSITLSPASQVVAVNSAFIPYVVTNTGGVIDYFTISPNLPDGVGLTFDSTTGLIAGTPNAEIPPTSYAITAINSGGTSVAIFTLTATLISAGPTETTIGTLLILTLAWICFVFIQRKRISRSH